ncbi:hypothetical protein GCM10009601_38110 [Streptomyces thermospinosisporus]|uniref:Uncharacterized protein n=1 Tax=Streptomyces thermospinosisporus TaxID=161482 RepID=A0ABP4JT10_9ACTN
MEVAAGDMPVPYGVAAQFRSDEHEDVMSVAAVRDSPGIEAVPAQTPGETGTARGGAEAHRELVHREG